MWQAAAIEPCGQNLKSESPSLPTPLTLGESLEPSRNNDPPTGGRAMVNFQSGNADGFVVFKAGPVRI